MAALTQRLAAPLADRRHAGGASVLRIAEGRHGVELTRWTPPAARSCAGRRALHQALPLFAARLVQPVPDF